MKKNPNTPFIWIAEHREYPELPYQFVFDGKPTMKDISDRFAVDGHPGCQPFPEDWMIRKFPVYQTKRSAKRRELNGII